MGPVNESTKGLVRQFLDCFEIAGERFRRLQLMRLLEVLHRRVVFGHRNQQFAMSEVSGGCVLRKVCCLFEKHLSFLAKSGILVETGQHDDRVTVERFLAEPVSYKLGSGLRITVLQFD